MSDRTDVPTTGDPITLTPQPDHDDGLSPGQQVEFVGKPLDSYGLVDRIGEDPDEIAEVALPGWRGVWLGTLPVKTFGYPAIHIIAVGDRFAPTSREHFIAVSGEHPAGWQPVPSVLAENRGRAAYRRRRITDREWLTVQERAHRWLWRWAPYGVLHQQGTEPSMYQAMLAADTYLASLPHRFISHNRPDGTWCRWSYVNTPGNTRLCPDRCPDSDIERDPTPDR